MLLALLAREDRLRLERDLRRAGIRFGGHLSVREVRLHRPQDLVGGPRRPHRLVKAEIDRAPASGSLPRCHLPHIPVAYPASDSAWAIVTSQRVNPSGPPAIGTACVPERIAWRPVNNADRLGVHCASTLKFKSFNPSAASPSIRGVAAPRNTPPP